MRHSLTANERRSITLQTFEPRRIARQLGSRRRLLNLASAEPNPLGLSHESSIALSKSADLLLFAPKRGHCPSAFTRIAGHNSAGAADRPPATPTRRAGGRAAARANRPIKRSGVIVSFEISFAFD